MRLSAILTAIALFFALDLNAQQLAFPGAEGFGRFSAGGRGGRTILVTNLNNSGAGSLRAAIEATGARKVVFQIGGTIVVTGDLVVRNPFISILGQTAPGTGICIKGGMIKTLTHDVVIRGIRVRTGNARQGGRGFQAAQGSENVIVDHCSFSWSRDAMVATWDTVSSITIQNCIIAEVLNWPNPQGGEGPHSVALGPGPGENEAGSRYATDISFLRNLVAHGTARNPKVHYEGEVCNNVVYNYGTMGCYLQGYALLDFIGNIYKAGPNTGNTKTVKIDQRLSFPELKAYVSDNRTRELPEGGGDQWAIVDGARQHQSNVRLNSSGYEPIPSVETMTHVIDHAGARPLDAVDVRILNELIQGTGSIKTSEGIYPVLSGSRTQGRLDSLIASHGGLDQWADSYFGEESQECSIRMIHPKPAVKPNTLKGVQVFKAEVECLNDSPIEVQFFLNGVLFFTDTESPYQWTCDTRRFVNYTHTVTMTVIDDTAPSSVSQRVAFLNFGTE